MTWSPLWYENEKKICSRRENELHSCDFGAVKKNILAQEAEMARVDIIKIFADLELNTFRIYI